MGAGLFVNLGNSQPGVDRADIRIRGIGTLNNNDPLVLANGIEYDMDELNPADIATISVLKDASAAIYGSRGANHSYNLEITDHAYKNKPLVKKIAAAGGETIVLDLKQSSGWYDFSVGIQNNPTFTRRYAGRVEIGKESVSDPLMDRAMY